MNDPLSTFGFIAAIRNTTSTASIPVPHTSNVFGHPLPPTRWCSTSQPAIDVPTPRSNRAGISARYTSRTIEFRLVNFPASIKSALHDFIRPRWPREARAYRQGEAYTITLDVRFRDTFSWHLFRARMEDYVRLQQEVVAWLLDRGWVFEHTMAARSSLPVISVQSSKFHKSDAQFLVFVQRPAEPERYKWLSISTHVPGELSVVGESRDEFFTALAGVFGSIIRLGNGSEPGALRIVYSPDRRRRLQLGDRFSAHLALLNLRDVVEDMGYSVYACVETLNAEGETMIARKRVRGNELSLALPTAQKGVSEKGMRLDVSGLST